MARKVSNTKSSFSPLIEIMAYFAKVSRVFGISLGGQWK